MQASAPSATAFTMSLPRRTPPSQMISIASPTASATGATSRSARARRRAGGRRGSTARSPSTPASTASTASSTVWMPLSTIGPSQIGAEPLDVGPRQRRVELRVDVARTATPRLPSPTSRPTTLANVIGSERANAHVHPGCNAPSTNVPGPSCGGIVNPRRTSRSRRPSTAVSTVMMIASYPHAAARSSMSFTRPRSRHT